MPTLLDRTIQWMFNKHEGRYVQLVVSASRSLVRDAARGCDRAGGEGAGEFFPAVREREARKGARGEGNSRDLFGEAWTGSACGRRMRPKLGNLFLAGDWTNSGWPATMEGAVRSGYLAAEAVTAAAGAARKFIKPDIA